MSSRNKFRVSLLAGAGAVLALSTAATAQQVTAAPGATAPEAALAAGDGEQLEDIVVVAQRRSERLQDVPISVTAVQASTLETAAVSSTTNLQTIVPGLQMTTQQTSISPFIRGIGNRNTSPGDESAAALYVDGVYTSSLAAAVFSLANVDRIEVLKGPQGTLFGRNAAAGVIQVITRRPSHDTEVDASATYANYDTMRGQFYATTGLSENLAADLSIYAMNQGNGWGTNVLTGNDTFKGYEFAARTKFLLTAGDNTEIQFGLDYDKNKPVSQPVTHPLEGARLLGGIGYLGFYNVSNTVDVKGVNEQWGTNLQVRHDFGGVRGVSITSYRDVKINLLFDQDGGPTNYTTATFTQYAHTATQEFQLLSADDSKIQWILGAFYFHDESAYNPLNLQGVALGGRVIDRFAKQTSSSYAGFGQATAEIFDATKLTGGLRYTSDKRRIEGRDIVNGVVSAPSVVDNAETFNKVTWRLALDHKFSDDVLGYGSFSRGFKSGVYSAAAPTQAAVRPEIVDAYEIGLKTSAFDRRLLFNTAVFYNKFKDVQLQVPVLGASTLINAARGHTKGIEVDIQALPVKNFQIGVSFSYLKGTYTNFPSAPGYASLPAGGNSSFAVDGSGNDTIYTPPFTASLTAQYRIPTNVGDFDLNGSLYYNDGFFFDPQNRVKSESYTLLNANIGWTSKSERFGINLFGRNLGGEKYYSQVVSSAFGDTAVPDAPRTYGITAKVKFN